MTQKFHGDLDDLKRLVKSLDIDGAWQPRPHGVWTFRCRDRSGLHWSETKGTVWFDGLPALKARLAKRVEALFEDGEVAPETKRDGAQIFVVHGRDHEARDQLELVLRRLNLKPFVLEVTGGGGDTLIEALEKQIGKTAESQFGIVLLTPDDMGYLKEDGPEDAKPRARQNVIMEMGMLLASLTRRRCAILQKGFVDIPSNMQGVIVIPFNDHVREAVPKLVQRLEEAGFHLAPSAVGRAQA